MSQSRYIMVTDKAVYNYQKKSKHKIKKLKQKIFTSKKFKIKKKFVKEE